MAMIKFLPYLAIGLALLIIVNEIYWIGKTQLARIIIALALSIILLAINQIYTAKQAK